MDTREWRERNVGIPTNPLLQRDPHEEEHLPAQGGAEQLTDLTSDGGGQRTEVGLPYSGEGDLQRGVREAMSTDFRRRRHHH